jgi:hypothetical protein
MKQIIYNNVTYNYTYTSLDLARISMLTATEKLPEALEYCITLVTPQPADPVPESLAVTRFHVSQMIMGEISTAINTVKNSPAPSEPAKP